MREHGYKVIFRVVYDSEGTKNPEPEFDMLLKQIEQLKDIYVSNLKADISAKLKEKGYEIDTSDIQIKDDENYTIEKITLKLIKMEQKQEKNNEIVINTVEIGNTISQKDSKTLSDDDKQEVKDYISETYDIDKKNINIS